MENEKIVINKHGQEVECDILFTFDSEDTGKAYIGYSDHTIGPNGRKNIYISAYDPVMGIDALEDIKDEEELAMVRGVLAQIDNQSRD